MIALPQPDRGGTQSGVIVVGAGIAGASLAWHLVRAGVRVTLVDAAHAGASAVPVGLINPFRGRSARPGPFDLSGAEAFWNLAREVEGAGLPSGAVRSGVLRVPANERQVRSWRSREGLLELTSQQSFVNTPQGAFLAEQGGFLDPRTLVGSLLELFRRSGGDHLRGRQVDGLRNLGGSWAASVDGERLEAHYVVLCTGAADLPRADGQELGLGEAYERSAGDVIELRPRAGVTLELPFAVAGPVYLAQLSESVFVGGNRRGAAQPDVRAPELMAASAARLVPALQGAQVVSRWTGVRLKHVSNEPQRLELAPGLWFLGAFGGRGFLTGPLFARELAKDLLARLS